MTIENKKINENQGKKLFYQFEKIAPVVILLVIWYLVTSQSN